MAGSAPGWMLASLSRTEQLIFGGAGLIVAAELLVSGLIDGHGGSYLADLAVVVLVVAWIRRGGRAAGGLDLGVVIAGATALAVLDALFGVLIVGHDLTLLTASGTRLVESLADWVGTGLMAAGAYLEWRR
jgi:hypothetical protein